MSDHRAYGSIRSLVERLGGSMVWRRGATPRGLDHHTSRQAHGDPGVGQAVVPGNSMACWFRSTRTPRRGTTTRTTCCRTRSRGYWPCCATPHRPSPSRLIRWTGSRSSSSDALEILPRMARTFPHEYTTKTKGRCAPDDHARLIDCIERYGVIERFGNSGATTSTSRSASTGTWATPTPRTLSNGRTSSTAPGSMSGGTKRTSGTRRGPARRSSSRSGYGRSSSRRRLTT